MEENIKEDKDATEEEMLDQGGIDSSEEGFMKGYAEDEEVVECDECGSACNEEKKIIKDIEGEKYTFCSKDCLKEFQESMGNN